MKPRQLLNTLRLEERKRQVGPEIRFHHLDKLPNVGNCRVLRTNHEIFHVAEKLNNCATSYISGVKSERLVLVVLKNTKGTPVALGMHPLADHGKGFTQIFETNNHRKKRLRSSETIPVFCEGGTEILYRYRLRLRIF